MKSFQRKKIAVCIGLLVFASATSRAGFFFDFDAFDDAFYQTQRRIAQSFGDGSRLVRANSDGDYSVIDEESVVLPDVTIKTIKNDQRLVLVIKGLKNIKAEDIKSTFSHGNRVLISFPYRKANVALEVGPRGYVITGEKEITQTNEKKDAAGTVISGSSTSYRGRNSQSESFKFKIDVASIKNPENQPKLEGENLIFTFDTGEAAGETIKIEVMQADVKKKARANGAKTETILKKTAEHDKELPEK